MDPAGRSEEGPPATWPDHRSCHWNTSDHGVGRARHAQRRLRPTRPGALRSWTAPLAGAPIVQRGGSRCPATVADRLAVHTAPSTVAHRRFARRGYRHHPLLRAGHHTRVPLELQRVGRLGDHLAGPDGPDHAGDRLRGGVSRPSPAPPRRNRRSGRPTRRVVRRSHSRGHACSRPPIDDCTRATRPDRYGPRSIQRGDRSRTRDQREHRQESRSIDSGVTASTLADRRRGDRPSSRMGVPGMGLRVIALHTA